MATINPTPTVGQKTPTRFFVLRPLDPYAGTAQFEQYREMAYGLVVGRILQFGQIPATYDVRPANPSDDFSGFTSAYNSDWSIPSGSIGTTDGKLSGAGNIVLTGSMPTNRFITIYGTEIQTPSTPVEIGWLFKSGNNVKTAWVLTDLFGYMNPRGVTAQMPLWGSNDPMSHVLIADAAQPVIDVHLSLWGEPTGTTITASNIST